MVQITDKMLVGILEDGEVFTGEVIWHRHNYVEVMVKDAEGVVCGCYLNFIDGVLSW